uniref:Uncharacterized protein n=1 Tax=Heterorhabditis bacteriophora TaxID=37862 RepID=A0A1I7WXQ2_HETBA
MIVFHTENFGLFHLYLCFNYLIRCYRVLDSKSLHFYVNHTLFPIIPVKKRKRTRKGKKNRRIRADMKILRNTYFKIIIILVTIDEYCRYTSLKYIAHLTCYSIVPLLIAFGNVIPKFLVTTILIGLERVFTSNLGN